jgi:two-component system sensor histidine kinase CreC
MRTRLEGKQYVEHYVHTLTHEMKSPLAAIRGSAELLEGPLEEADRARFVANIRAQSERLAQMIDKMLALAAVEHRQRLENPEPLRLADMVEDAAAQCATRLAQAGLALDVHSEELPPVMGDAFLLRQAVVNLIENAVDFAPPGSRIEVAVERDGERQRVRVLDRGPGIPDYAVGRVFERFYSLPRPDNGSRSSGLGLCFVAEVATLHGGEAALKNRNGGGAVASLVVG